MKAFKKEMAELRKKSSIPYNRHHRCPKRIGGSDEEWNISLVKKKQHDAWNVLFGELSPHQIADFISNIWIDPNFKFVCIPTSADVVIIQKHKAS